MQTWLFRIDRFSSWSGKAISWLVLSRAQHVRGDIFYRKWSVKTQAKVDLFLYIFAFFPGILAMVSIGAQWAALSWAINEHAPTSAAAPPLYPLKTVIPIAALLLAIQGVAETIRCVEALRTGVWPPRLSDVEETETILAKQSEPSRSSSSWGTSSNERASSTSSSMRST